jgi:hypothetical protein
MWADDQLVTDARRAGRVEVVMAAGETWLIAWVHDGGESALGEPPDVTEQWHAQTDSRYSRLLQQRRAGDRVAFLNADLHWSLNDQYEPSAAEWAKWHRFRDLFRRAADECLKAR